MKGKKNLRLLRLAVALILLGTVAYAGIMGYVCIREGSVLKTVPAAELMDFLKQYTQKEQVDTFVVGHAKQMDATDSESMQYIQPFVEKLKKEFVSTPVEMVDERFTSKIAFQAMIDGGLKKKQRQDKALIDTVSATIILQSYMEQKKRK